MAKIRQSWFEKAEKWPPFIVYALARHNRRSPDYKGTPYMLFSEIVERSGLPSRTVQRITTMKSWDGIKFATIKKFTAACNFDFEHTKHHLKFIRNSLKAQKKFTHLNRQRYNNFAKICEEVDREAAKQNSTE